MERPACAFSRGVPVARVSRGLAIAGLCLAGAAGFPVQAQEQVFSADMVGKPESAAAFEEASLAELNPLVVVTAFEQACVLSGAQPAAAVDWAMANDFEAVDPATTSLDGLLGGQPGTVLAAPGTAGRVMLAVSAGQCSVWAERTAGPPLRSALAALVDTLASSGKGHKVQLLLDRSAERAGAWRNQMEWRYRAAGSRQDWVLGVATTLGDGLGTQVLHMAPAAAEGLSAR